MRFPLVGPLVPRRRYGPLGALGRLWLRAARWRIVGDFPDVSKVVVIVAPHSSNWDFVHAIAVIFALGLRASFLGKHTLFRGPLGSFMRWTGGIALDRGSPGDAANAAIEVIRNADAIWLGIAPEGTRSAGARFKSGFYRIAMGAGVPLLPIAIDYRRRAFILHPLHAPTDDAAAGVAAISGLLLSSGTRRDDARAGKRR